MASLQQHCQDCERLLGTRAEHVHIWLDELYRQFGSVHRTWRHHTRGVNEAEKLFGELGRKAAIIHILRDCGDIPKARDYVDERVDACGVRINSRFDGTWDDFVFIEAVQKRIGV